jgi:zinc transporter ZupT
MARNIHYLATFSIGIFGVIVWTLGVEAVEHMGAWRAAGAAAFGAAVVWTAARLIPDSHHHHEVEEHSHGHSPVDARRLLVSDAFHNVTDGFLLVPAYAASPITGLIATLAIFAHELVQETAKFFVLKEAGYTDREAMVKSFLAASSILIGVAAAALLSSVEGIEALLISFSAGGFLFLILIDLLPNTIQSVRHRGKAHIHVAAAILGFAVMGAIALAAPHGHDEPEASQESGFASAQALS